MPTPRHTPQAIRNHAHYTSPKSVDEFISEYYYRGQMNGAKNHAAQDSSVQKRSSSRKRRSTASIEGSSATDRSASRERSSKRPFLVRQSQSEHMSSAFAHATTPQSANGSGSSFAHSGSSASLSASISQKKPLYSNGLTSLAQSEESFSTPFVNRKRRSQSQHNTAPMDDSAPRPPPLMMTPSGISTPALLRSNYVPDDQFTLAAATGNPLLRRSPPTPLTASSQFKKKATSSSMKQKQLQQMVHNSTNLDAFIKRLNLKTTKTFLPPKYNPLWKDVTGEDQKLSFAESALREKWNNLAYFFRKRRPASLEETGRSSSTERRRRRGITGGVSGSMGRSGSVLSGTSSTVPEKSFTPSQWIKYVKQSLMHEMSQTDASSRAQKNMSDYEQNFETLFEMAHDDYFVVSEEDDEELADLKKEVSSLRMGQKMASHVLMLLGQLNEYVGVLQEENDFVREEEQFWAKQVEQQRDIQEKLVRERQKSFEFMRGEDDEARGLLEEIEVMEREKKVLNDMIEHRKGMI